MVSTTIVCEGVNAHQSMRQSAAHTVQSVTDLLTTVVDPEIPVINIVELGIVRKIDVKDEHVTVTITPTYSGCPAMSMITEDICSVLQENGIGQVSVKTVYSPAWTTDWITGSAKQKLKEYGIAPPHLTIQSPLLQIDVPNVRCPRCTSDNTELKSDFGSTACKAFYQCHACHQSFEYFKSL